MSGRPTLDEILAKKHAILNHVTEIETETQDIQTADEEKKLAYEPREALKTLIFEIGISLEEDNKDRAIHYLLKQFKEMGSKEPKNARLKEYQGINPATDLDYAQKIQLNDKKPETTDVNLDYFINLFDENRLKNFITGVNENRMRALLTYLTSVANTKGIKINQSQNQITTSIDNVLGNPKEGNVGQIQPLKAKIESLFNDFRLYGVTDTRPAEPTPASTQPTPQPTIEQEKSGADNHPRWLKAGLIGTAATAMAVVGLTAYAVWNTYFHTSESKQDTKSAAPIAERSYHDLERSPFYVKFKKDEIETIFTPEQAITALNETPGKYNEYEVSAIIPETLQTKEQYIRVETEHTKDLLTLLRDQKEHDAKEYRLPCNLGGKSVSTGGKAMTAKLTENILTTIAGKDAYISKQEIEVAKQQMGSNGGYHNIVK